MRAFSVVLLLALTPGLPACVGTLAQWMVEPRAGAEAMGLGSSVSEDDRATFRRVVRERLATDVFRVPGVQGDELQVYAFEPDEYGVEWEIGRSDDGHRFRFSFEFGAGEEPRRDPPSPSGTVVLLHGLYAESMQVLPQALRFAERGYRTVLLDLRAHGQSDGRYVSFGVRERRDLARVLDALRRRDLMRRPLVLYGTSLGAAVALQGAGQGIEAERIVALGAFAEAREVVLEGAPRLLPGWLSWAASNGRLDAAADRAEELAGFEFEDANTLALASDLEVPVLLLHGRDDRLVPVEHARRLHRGIPCSELLVARSHDHASLLVDPGLAVDSVARWLDREPDCESRLSRADGPPGVRPS